MLFLHALLIATTPFEIAKSAVTAAETGKVDVNADGYAEMQYVKRIADRGGHPYESAGKDRGTVLVLVESRLLEPLPGARSLERPLERLVKDLSSEGYSAFGLSVKLEDGTKKQGGLTLLALRRVLQTVWAKDRSLAGAILVGRFPSAFIVRRHWWERTDDVTVAGKHYTQRRWVVSRPEPVATNADIVLGDMDGNWDRVYQKEAKQLPYFIAVMPGIDMDVATKEFETGTHSFSDYFYVDDGNYRQVPEGDGVRFDRVKDLDRECTPEDKRLPNPMARPEISISRLDASMVALQPNPQIKGLTDKSGRPREVVFEKEKPPDVWKRWQRDPTLERKLLYEYFERNHAYRTGKAPSGGPANYSTEWDSSIPDLKKTVANWSAMDTNACDLAGGNLTINEFVEWMKTPMSFRAIKAHTAPTGSEYGASKDVNALRKSLNGLPYGWETKDNTLVLPDFANGFGNYQLYRTLYENKCLAPIPVMYLHTGCDSTTPPLYDSRPFGDENYGKFQGAQALMMYCNGLVLMGRGKVFNDEPADFAKLLGAGKTWGEIWRHYFDADAANALENANDAQGIRRKKAYFWDLFGDWTIRLRP